MNITDFVHGLRYRNGEYPRLSPEQKKRNYAINKLHGKAFIQAWNEEFGLAGLNPGSGEVLQCPAETTLHLSPFSRNTPAEKQLFCRTIHNTPFEFCGHYIQDENHQGAAQPIRQGRDHLRPQRSDGSKTTFGQAFFFSCPASFHSHGTMKLLRERVLDIKLQ